MVKKIKLFDPIINSKEEDAIKKVLTSGFWASGSGSGNVKKFEEKFNEFIKSKNCVAVNSGTAALHLALSMLDIKNKEVIIPSLSFVSTAHAVLYNHGIPIFADVDSKTLNLDPKSIQSKITKKTKAIIPVHFGGLPAEIEEINNIAKSNNLEVIEDAAHACGAHFNRKRIGKHSSFVCFSFHPVKNLAMPNGGLISINKNNSKNLKEKLNSLRWCGISNRKDVHYDVSELGWNYYMNEFSAAIGLVQLKKLDKLNQKRKEIAKVYFDELKIDEKMPYNQNAVYHYYWILVKNRDKFRSKMSKHKIETGIHYSPIHQMKIYKNNIHLKNTEDISKKIVTIPTHPNLSENDVDYIIKTINRERYE